MQFPFYLRKTISEFTVMNKIAIHKMLLNITDKFREMIVGIQFKLLDNMGPQAMYLVKNIRCYTSTQFEFKGNNFQKTDLCYDKTFNRNSHLCCKCD